MEKLVRLGANVNVQDYYRNSSTTLYYSITTLHYTVREITQIGGSIGIEDILFKARGGY